MTVAASRLSAAEYLATPEVRPEHTELIDGVVVVNEARLPHAVVQGNLYYAFRRWMEGPAGGHVGLPADVPVDDANVFAPDLWWVGPERAPAEGQLDLEGLPDLVVEIRSPSTWARDLSRKLPRYEAIGISEAWYVDTSARSVLVFRRSERTAPAFDVRLEVQTDEVLASPLLDGFRMPVGELFVP